MLKSWTVEGFKSIYKKTPLELAPITIFAGENSSGKSTVIQSILLVAQTLQSNSPGRSVVLNGNIIRLGSFSDIVSGQMEPPIISFGFEISPSSIDYRPYEYGKNIYINDDFFRNTTKIECNFSFSGDGLDGRETLQLHPRLVKSSLNVSYLDSEGREKNNEVAISRRNYQLTDFTSEEKLSTDIAAGIEPSLSYSVEKPKSYRPRYRSVAVKNGKPVGCICKHFLPIYLSFIYDAVEEFANHAINSLLPDRMSENASELNKGFDLIKSSEQVRNLLLSIISELMSTPPYSNRTGLSERIDRLRADFSRENWGSVVNALGLSGRRLLMQRLNEDETSNLLRDKLKANLPPENKAAYGPFSPRIEHSVEYVEWYFSTSVKYVGPLRDEPKPLYPLGGGSESFDVGYKGELTAAVFEAHKNNTVKYVRSSDLERLGHKAEPISALLSDAVKDWLCYIGVAEGIETNDKGKLGHELRISPLGSGEMHELTHVGVGVSQLLPILVQALLMPRSSILILEQPELHLHPRVQSRLADLLVSLALVGKQVLVETHSEYLINKLRFLSAKGEGSGIAKLSKIYFVQKQNGTSVYNPMQINEFGVISNWPQGFFDEAEELASETIKAATLKRRNQITSKKNANLDESLE